MPLQVNLRHLEQDNLHLCGELAVEELEIEVRDEMIRLREPLRYDMEVQLLDDSLLIRGSIGLTLDCECVRCLKPFSHPLRLDDWHCHIPLTGEDKAPVENDSVDLTPYLREDIFLAFPQHPLCEPECGGVVRPAGEASHSGHSQDEPTVWAELNKLKLND